MTRRKPPVCKCGHKQDMHYVGLTSFCIVDWCECKGYRPRRKREGRLLKGRKGK